jgi:hypothetical protein
MLRRVFVIGFVALTVAPSVDLGACGDKFLRAGRSSKMKHYAAIHPASILLYTPANAPAEGVNDWLKMLRRAGHKSLVVRPGNDFSRTVADGRYDVVIADYREAKKISDALLAVPAGPAVLPVLSKAPKALVEDAKKQYPQIIIPAEMEEFQALEAIDELMALRSKGRK